jgi:hypothetical protein
MSVKYEDGKREIKNEFIQQKIYPGWFQSRCLKTNYFFSFLEGE